MISPLIFYDSKTSAETDWECGMKYWWQKYHGGGGIVPVEEASYFLAGRQLHEDMEPFAKGVSVETACDLILPLPTDATQVQLEQWSRRKGWVTAWGLYIEPYLRAFGDEVLCEDELLLCRDPLRVRTRPDRVQRRRGGGLVYREWKTTASTRREWCEGWRYSIQLHIGLAALGEASGEKAEYGQVTGLYKGTEKDGRLVHPYVWAYFKDGEWSHEWKRGWDHRPVWEYEGGYIDWVTRCGKETADKMFVWSPPVGLDTRIIDRYVTRRIERLREVATVKDACQTDIKLREEHFEMRFSKCRPPYGEPCQYLAACHNASVNANPVESGLYIPRGEH